MDKTTIYLPTDLHESLKELARRTGRPQAALIREAVEAYVVENEAQPPWPKTIGMFPEISVASTEVEDWLEKNWESD